MRQNVAAASIILLASATLYAQTQTPEPSGKTPHPAKAARTAYFIDPTLVDLTLILPPPPAQDSATTKAELADLHHIEQTRTPEQVAAAQADDREEDIFIFRDVIGKNFTSAELPLTAALSAHVHNDEGVAGAPLKKYYLRPRPFQVDSGLHPVCALNKEPSSYPSGHTLSGYLLAFTLVQLVPEKRQQILDRADDYAHNRTVCGVHYASDTEASRRIAYVLFGYMLASPRFQKELSAAQEETRRHLGLPLTIVSQTIAGQ